MQISTRRLVTLLAAATGVLAGAPPSSGAVGLQSAVIPTGVGHGAPVDAGWEKRAGADAPRGRAYHQMVYDAGRDEMIMFGGYRRAKTGLDRFANGTWAWDGARWRELTTEHRPPNRAYHSMAYDPVRDEIVLFGGFHEDFHDDQGGGARNDTWVFADGDWTRRRPDVSPDHLYLASMAFDPHLQQLVMFGGWRSDPDGYEIVQETWTWDGTTWQELDPATKPPIREDAGLAYDPALGRLVLFGGVQYGSSELNDTWSWDGATWQQVEDAAQAPPPRSGLSMATFGEDVVVYGGEREGSYFDDTWVLESDGWRPLESALSPLEGTSAKMAWDPVRNEAVLSGGVNRHRPYDYHYHHQTLTLAPDAEPDASR